MDAFDSEQNAEDLKVETIKESKSMDTILLDASGFELPSVDLIEESPEKLPDDDLDEETIQSGDAAGQRSISEDEGVNAASEEGVKLEVSVEDVENSVTDSGDVNDISDVTSTPMKTGQVSSSALSQYFTSPTSEVGGGGLTGLGDQAAQETGVDFFNSFSVPSEVPEAEPDKQEVTEKRDKKGVMFEDVVPVDFEEEKGSGLQLTGSIKNLNKYFNEAIEQQDDDAKVFFESFTAATEEEIIPTARTRTESSSSVGAAKPKLEPSKQPTPYSSPAHTQRMNSQNSVEAVPVIKVDDSSRRNDAWLAPENIKVAMKIVMQNRNSSEPTVNLPELHQLTMPGVITDQVQGDPVYDLVLQFIGEGEAAKRSTFAVDDVTQDDNGLRQLVGAECWRAALELTSRLITEEGQGPGKVNQPSQNTPRTLQLWFTRIALLVKLKMYTVAEAECEAFGNFEQLDLYYAFYGEQHPDKHGSLVPFSFRLLHAELPQYLGRAQETLDRLYYLHGIIKQILDNLYAGLTEDGSEKVPSEESRGASLKVWKAREIRTLHSVGNCLMRIKDYRSAVKVFEDLVPSSGSSKEALLCGIGRIHLQMGNVAKAEEFFSVAETKSDSESGTRCHDKLNKGFVALGLTQCHEAYKHFQLAQSEDPDNAAAINNLAVCLLYTCKLREALDALEGLVHRDPFQYLQEGILFNLCTLYELESSHALARKQSLLDLVSKYKGNGFNTSCLKLS